MSKDFYKYLNEYDIHVIDYSIPIDIKEGIERIEILGKYFNEHIKNANALKILIDSKGYIKENPETHDALAKISRLKFAEELKSINVFTAVLNDHYTFSVSERERWFINREEAINWLIKQPA